jgi:hypothetical protein
MERLAPSTARRTLGVIMAPDGSSKDQIKTSLSKALVFLGKIKHSNLSKQAKWTAITSLLEPEVYYPLMATMCNKKDFDKIDRPIVRAKCSALGLNKHFPRAIIHGPLEYGGMAIPTSFSKTVATRINYFLYHIRTSSKIGIKLDASIVFLQLEVGLFTSFFQSSYEAYGFLATKTMTKQIWAETEPYGLQLRHHQHQTWLSLPQGTRDIPLMEIACRNYSRKDATRINRYRLYLRVISMYDILTYDGTQIHPELAKGKRVSSRMSTIHWVEFPKPPKKDAALWIAFIDTHIKPLAGTIPIRWNGDSFPTYRTTFMKSSLTDKLYQRSEHGLLQYDIKRTRRRTIYPTFQKDSIIIDPDTELYGSFIDVDTHCRHNDIQILCESNINSRNKQTPPDPNNDLKSLYYKLPKALQRLCGSINFPEDDGTSLIQYLIRNDKPLLGASDASEKWQR